MLHRCIAALLHDCTNAQAEVREHQPVDGLRDLQQMQALGGAAGAAPTITTITTAAL
jgi:hypothetical protein